MVRPPQGHEIVDGTFRRRLAGRDFDPSFPYRLRAWHGIAARRLRVPDHRRHAAHGSARRRPTTALVLQDRVYVTAMLAPACQSCSGISTGFDGSGVRPREDHGDRGPCPENGSRRAVSRAMAGLTRNGTTRFALEDFRARRGPGLTHRPDGDVRRPRRVRGAHPPLASWSSRSHHRRHRLLDDLPCHHFACGACAPDAPRAVSVFAHLSAMTFAGWVAARRFGSRRRSVANRGSSTTLTVGRRSSRRILLAKLAGTLIAVRVSLRVPAGVVHLYAPLPAHETTKSLRMLEPLRQPLRGGALKAMDAALPLVFMAIIGVSLMLYVILDGYNLGSACCCRSQRPPRRTR